MIKYIDPFKLVIKAVRNLYPGLDCNIEFDPSFGECEPPFGITDENTETGDFRILISAHLPVIHATEIMAHELAHVAAGIDVKHGHKWKRVFNAIHKEFYRIQLVKTVKDRRRQIKKFMRIK